MCVIVPSPIVEILPGTLPMARVQHGEKLLTCCLAYVPEAKVGDYVLVQNGFAVELLDETQAAESLAAFEELRLAYDRPATA